MGIGELSSVGKGRSLKASEGDDLQQPKVVGDKMHDQVLQNTPGEYWIPPQVSVVVTLERAKA